MTLFLRYLAIGGAGFVGALARYVLVLAFARLNFRFPIGTLFINVTGSMFLGWFYQYTRYHITSDMFRVAIATGFVGAYTTFSTYMWESVTLAQDGAWKQCAANIFGSIALGLLGVLAGIWLANAGPRIAS